MSIINPPSIGNDMQSREAWLKQVAKAIDVEYPRRSKTLVDELRSLPSTQNVLLKAVKDGKALEDVREDLILSYVAEVTSQRYAQQLESARSRADNYAERRKSITPQILKRAEKVYKDIAKVLTKLPEDALDRDAAYEMDATAEQKALISSIQMLNILVGVHGRNSALGIPPGFELLRYVVIDPDAEGDMRDFTASLQSRDVEHATLLINAVRGVYGGTVTAALPTREQVAINYEALNVWEQRRRRAAYGANPRIDMTSVNQPNLWKSAVQ